MGKRSLMKMLQDAGYPLEKMYHWQSDLHVFATKETDEVINRWCAVNGYNRELFVKTFRDNITGRTMFDIAFQYDPYWDKAGEAGKS